MSEPKKKMGRPPLPKGEARELFTMRLSPNEKALYSAAADAAKEPLADWMRNALTRAAKRATS